VKPLIFGETMPQVKDDTPFIKAGLISTFTDDFFYLYNAEFTDIFLNKMAKLKTQGAMDDEFCDFYAMGNVATVHMCISE
jgi:hypothetical protein